MKADNSRKSKNLFGFEKKVFDTIGKYDLISENDRVLVALSGGADSVCLLRVLAEISEKIPFELCACHLNHGIRGASADSDELFSKELCKSLSIPFYSEKLNIPEIKNNSGGSIETVARNERYSFFDRAAKALDCNKTATAHTMSDNAETVLFNIARGTSIDGISGIPVKRGKFIRPLLDCTRQEIEDYLFALSQDFVTDETNSDQDYTRNFVRHSIIPQFKAINPLFEQAVLRLSKAASADRDFFETLTQKVVDSEPDLAELCKMHPSVLSRYIKNLCDTSDVYADAGRVDAIISAAKEIIVSGGSKKISLPGNSVAKISIAGIEITKNIHSEPVSFNIPLSYGNNSINEKYCIFTSRSDDPVPGFIQVGNRHFKMLKNIRISSDAAENGIFARNRQNGDTVVIGGMTRKLKKVFCDMKLSEKEKSQVPIVCNADGNIIALALFSVPADTAKPQSETEYIQLAFFRAENDHE